VKTLRSGSLVFGVGGSVAQNPDGSTERFLSLGPTYNWNTVDATLRYIPSWIHPGSGAGSFELALNVGSGERTTSTLTLDTGVVPASLIGQAFTTSELDERTFAADLNMKHWMSRQYGWRLGLNFGREQDRSSNAVLSSWRGVSFGILVATHRDPADGDHW
jgi:hypothetical protein